MSKRSRHEDDDSDGKSMVLYKKNKISAASASFNYGPGPLLRSPFSLSGLLPGFPFPSGHKSTVFDKDLTKGLINPQQAQSKAPGPSRKYMNENNIYGNMNNPRQQFIAEYQMRPMYGDPKDEKSVFGSELECTKYAMFPNAPSFIYMNQDKEGVHQLGSIINANYLLASSKEFAIESISGDNLEDVNLKCSYIVTKFAYVGLYFSHSTVQNVNLKDVNGGSKKTAYLYKGTVHNIPNVWADQYKGDMRNKHLWIVLAPFWFNVTISHNGNYYRTVRAYYQFVPIATESKIDPILKHMQEVFDIPVVCPMKSYYVGTASPMNASPEAVDSATMKQLIVKDPRPDQDNLGFSGREKIYSSLPQINIILDSLGKDHYRRDPIPKSAFEGNYKSFLQTIPYVL